MKNRKPNRMLAVILTVMLMFSVMAPFSAAMAATKKGTVFGGWLLLRQTPSYSGAVISSYPSGTVVSITGQSGAWYAVTAPDGLSGYMRSSYLKVSGGGSSLSEGTAYVISNNGLNVRMRTGPGTEYKVLAAYAPGTKCTILSVGATWCRISVGSYTGYMMSRFLTNSKPGPDPTPTPTPSGGTWYVTSSNGRAVNLREGPGTGYRSLGSYNVGTKVQMVNSGEIWSYICIGGVRYGYMMTQFLTRSMPDPVIPDHTGAYIYSRNGGTVNVRSGPGKEFEVLGAFAVGTELSVISRGSVWYYIHIGEYYGYVMKQYVREPFEY